MPGKTQRALRNSAIQGVSQVLTWSLSWVLLIMLPRFLGDEGFGTLFFALSYGTIFGTLLNLGINKYLVREVAVLNPIDKPGDEQDVFREKIRRLLGSVFAMKLALAVAVYALMAVTVVLLPYDRETVRAVWIIALAVCIGDMTLTLGSVFQGFENMMPPNFGLIAEKALTTGIAAALLLTGHGLLLVCWVYVGAAALNFAIVLGLLLRRISFRPVWDAAIMRAVFLGGLPFLIWVIFGQIYARIDAFMLSLMVDKAVVGWYGAAFRLYSTLLFIPHMLNTVVFPPLARMGADEEQGADFARASERLLNLLLFIAIPIGAGTALVAGPLVRLLYGEGPFLNTIPNLQIFGGSIVLVCIDVMLGSILISRGLQKQWAWMAVAAAAFNPVMNAWMIPLTQKLYGNGGIGAAWATLLTELLMMGGALYLMPRGILRPQSIVVGLKGLLAAALMSAAVIAVESDNLFVVIAVGAAVYVPAALLLGIPPRKDLRHLLHALKIVR
ncbi:flippase [Kiritimatiella glycovorans]|uniref:Polysaccharide biosynthesis protein n=1 Tax=Kiritimatiella glycovorans TaxID=1307763 RepID=A0A0G3EN29_9BACT|nr:flippase [Kiritimatiella glycovorans]AKJ65554.1 Polysaccharide biosynthesis protein [Kiritimatiella glycovorans]